MKCANRHFLICLTFISILTAVAQIQAQTKTSRTEFTINRECDGGACHFQTISFNYGRDSSVSVGIGDATLFYYFSVQVTNGNSSKEYIYHDEPRPHFIEKNESLLKLRDCYCTHLETSEKMVGEEHRRLLLDVFRLGNYIFENDIDTRNKTYFETGRFAVLTSLRNYVIPSRPLSSTTESRALPSSLTNLEQKTVWTEIDRGKKTGKFQFSPNRTLLYEGRPITGIRFKSTAQKIAISPSSPSGKYAICVAFDEMNSAGYLLHLDSHSGKRLGLQGPPSVWAAWSPAGTHAVIGSYYEADETLYSISLSSGIVRRFSFQLAKQTEEESYDLDNLTWVDNNVFRLRVTVNCNPYTDDNCSDQDRAKILREYEIKANVATLAVRSERLR